MANFRVHVLGATVPSLIAAGLAVAGELATPVVGCACFGLGVLGGMLPDIDADNSAPTRILFAALAVVAAAAVVLALRDHTTPWLVALAALVAFLVIRVGLRGFTAWLCVHRGLVHSLPFAALVGVLVVLTASHAFHLAATSAWLAGAFLTAGFLIHLTLDELYSVDLLGARMKRSFGTALKLGSRRQLLGTLVLYAGVLGLLTVAPSADHFLRDLTSSRTRAAIAATFAKLR